MAFHNVRWEQTGVYTSIINDYSCEATKKYRFDKKHLQLAPDLLELAPKLRFVRRGEGRSLEG